MRIRSPLLPMLLALSPLYAQRVAEIEPNDTPATAQPVVLGTQIDASLTAGEQDWFSFSLATNSRIRIHTTGLDTRIALWDAAGLVLFALDEDARGSGNAFASDLTLNVPAGSYAAQVVGFNASTAGPYSFEIASITLRVYTQAEVEPNDSHTTATLVDLSSNPALISGSLSSGSDVDYYRVVLPNPTSLWVQITEGEAPSVYGHRYEFYDSMGVLLVASTFGTNAANASSFNPRTSQVRVWPAGTYHIAVRSPSTPYTAPYNALPTGNYSLELYVMPLDTGAVVLENPEPNNTVATASPILPGQIGQGSITISSGADPTDIWGPITVTEPSTITLQSRQGGLSPLLDSTVRLLDASGAVLLTATAGNLLSPTSHGRIAVTFFLTPFTFYIEVLSPGTAPSMAGDYELQVSEVIPAPYVPASYANVSANGSCGIAPFPQLVRQFASETPLLGTTFARQVTNAPSSVPFIHMLGFDNLTANGGTVPLPFSMAPFGAPGCTINVDPLFLAIGTTSPTGAADIITTLPGNVAFRGIVLWEQVIVQNLAANPFGVQITGIGRLITGERSY